MLNGDSCRLFRETEEPLLLEFCALMMTRLFSPKVIIDYERTAFTEPLTHIRITLDRNITASFACSSFTDGSYLQIPLQQIHQNILEVKFDEILPGWLKNMIGIPGIRQTTFSKYYLGRKRLEDFLQ